MDIVEEGFTLLDYTILIVYMIAVAGLGSWFSRKQRDARDYFLGGKNIPWIAVSLSVVATETSTLTFIGIPALAYDSDISFMQLTFGYFIARILISLLFLPSYYRGEMFTAYEFLKRRFGERIRRFAASIFIITRVLADGVRLFATAIPLSIITGLPYLYSISAIGVVTIIYTYLGGIRAVVWMDVIQLLVYLGGAVAAFFSILSGLPEGWSSVVSTAEPLGKFNILNLGLDWKTTYTIWSGIIGGTFLTMASHGTDQLMVQRLLTCKNVRGSQKALILSGVLIMIQFLFFLVIGVMLYSFYKFFPSSLKITRSDEIFPLFIVHELPPGVSGLVIAGIFAAAMSTLSSSLNSLASSTMVDIYIPVLGKIKLKRDKPGESVDPSALKLGSSKSELLTSRMFTLLWGFILMGVAAVAGNWGNVLEAGLKIASFTYGGMLGAFLLGRLFNKATEMGTISGMLLGLIMMLFVSRTSTAWPWYVMIGCVTTVSTGMLFSYLSTKDKSYQEPTA